MKDTGIGSVQFVRFFPILLMIVSFFLNNGCAGPPFVEYFDSEFAVHKGPATVASTVDPTLGQIVFYGIVGAPLVTEADISVDDEFVRTLSSGDWIPAQASFGRHLLSAEVYLVQGGRRAGRIGCFRQFFEVSPYHRTAPMPFSTPRYPWEVPGYWWRAEIRSAAPCPTVPEGGQR